MSSPPHWLDEPRNRKRLWRAFLALLVLSVLAELVVTLHPHFEVEALPGFYAAYGFLTCAAMIIVAKAIGILLKRSDLYYRADDE